jgi:Arc/MetJ-type ribon-helix-helix transcriptional regulator
MASINVQIPDGMAEEMDEIVEVNGQYMNQSEYVRDAIRRWNEEQSLRLSEQTLRDIEISGRQFEQGDFHTHEEVKNRLGIED